MSPEEHIGVEVYRETTSSDFGLEPPPTWAVHPTFTNERWGPARHGTVGPKVPIAPPFLQILNRVIEESTGSILTLKPNFDGEGSPAYSKSTVDRAALFLRSLASVARVTGRPGFVLPRITPGPHGSVDLFWETQMFELLVNIPVDPYDPITFDGDNFGGVALTGELSPYDPIQPILRWIQDP